MALIEFVTCACLTSLRSNTLVKVPKLTTGCSISDCSSLFTFSADCLQNEVHLPKSKRASHSMKRNSILGTVYYS